MKTLDKFKEVFQKHRLIEQVSHLEIIKKNATRNANVAFTTWMLTILVTPLIGMFLSTIFPIFAYTFFLLVIPLSSIAGMDYLILKATKYYNKKLGYNYHQSQLLYLLKDLEVQKNVINYFNNLENLGIFPKEYNTDFKAALAEENYDNAIIQLTNLLPMIQEYHNKIEKNQSTQVKIQNLEKMLGVHIVEQENELDLELEHTNFKSLL